jgi:predicted GNAT family N-acyltransferase
MTIIIRPAEWQEQKHDLLRIRHAVFVDEQGVPVELEHDRHDEGALHLLAYPAGGQPVATARMLKDGHIGRMAVLSAWRGRGIGTAMLGELVRLARQRRIRALFLNAQCGAQAFYERLGFVAEGEVFEDAGIDHRRMQMPLEQNPGGGIAG